LILGESQAKNSAQNRIEPFTVTLAQPLKDNSGNTVLPTDTQLSVRVDEVSSTGRVRLSAIAATWNDNGSTQSIPLPENAIQIRAENGQPLIAQSSEDKGKEIAALDAGQFLLGGVKEASGQFTQSNTRVQTGNGTTIITQENQRPNVLASALKGGTDSILTSISERNRRAVEEIQARPVMRWIEAGKPVQVFVNQSVQIAS
jgi:Bacterial conjugation TrbI-like protein